MHVAVTAPVSKASDVNWTVAGILGLLIITALAIVFLTLTITQSRESDALVIDMAGRQRMLLERYMKELLVASQGAQADHARTRVVLQERLTALIHGGPTVASIDRSDSIVLPQAKSEAVRNKFLEQQRLLEDFLLRSEEFLRSPVNDVEQATVRDELLARNAKLTDKANEAVLLLTQQSTADVRRVIRWEALAVLLVVLIASVRTWRFLQAEKALKVSQQETVEALQRSDALKSALVSSVSHDLRTPLTAIKTMLYGLQDQLGPESDQAHKEFLRNIDQEVDYLDRLVGNLLDMSRIEAGALLPNREWYILEELVEGPIRRLESMGDGRVFNVHLAQNLPPLFVDGVQIQQVIMNLLDNAMKFSPSGSLIRLTASLVEDNLEVAVSNKGEGVPADELILIFERFHRVRTSTSPSFPGLGLGLAICKGIVEAHGGSIRAYSVPGEDTTISFQVPLAKTVPAHAQESVHAS
ncbi:MAG: hypothetical protein HOP00_05945 [Nitrospira sp.]|nr:hypothetical protein [Nitrospira sp.]